MEFDIGVPVANVMPRPPVISSIYLHFPYISDAFCESFCEIPATFLILVNKNRFLNSWLSSTNSLSTPSCSNVTALSFLPASLSLASLTSRFFFVFSICLIVKCSPFDALASLIDSVISSICSCISLFCLSSDNGILANWVCPMITAS